MKRLIVSSTGRPLPSSSKKWNLTKIIVTIYVDSNKKVTASSSIEVLDSLFTVFVDHLADAGYLPYLSLDVMKKKFHSPRSESEYYTFLKVSNEEKVKLILDIRFAEHHQVQHGRVSPKNNHLRFMESNRAKMSEELGFDTSEATVDFIDTVVEDKGFIEIDIDNYQAFSLSEAIRAFDSRITKLP